MEGNKQHGSSSSLTTELFGSKETSSSSTGIFGSIFAPSSKVLGRESLPSEIMKEQRDSLNETWIPKTGPQDDVADHGKGESRGIKNKDMSSIYQEQRAHPCHLSSSIFYGGQDVYSHPQNSHNSGVNSGFKEGGEDDGSASRGNWWQGSLYY